MNSFMEMEWGAKWDWENLVMYGSKVSESPKKLQLTDWGIGEEEGEMDGGSFNLSGGVSRSGGSVSDLGNGSSAKSSITASTNSSPKHGIKTSNLTFEALNWSFGAEPSRVELSGTVEGSVGSVEPLMGLKLGKRTYFENSFSGGNGNGNGNGNAKSPSSVISVPSTGTTGKKTKSTHLGAPIPRCQVEGCNLDLSLAKEYHRKHRVCDIHSKSPKVVIGCVERRFCQQCSRFHNLAEFDEKKRSCRRRLSDHNARRRKPHQETIQFNSSRLPMPFYDGRQQMNFVLNEARNAANPVWESPYNSKFTITRPDKSEGMHWLDQLPHSNTSNGFLALKGGTSQIPGPGMNESMFCSTVDAAPEYRRVLSLLSTESYGSYEPQSISLDNHHPDRVSHSSIPQSLMHAIPPQGFPFASAEHWQTGQESTYPRGSGLGLLEQIPIFKSTYDHEFPLN